MHSSLPTWDYQDLKLRTSNSSTYASYNFCTVKAIQGVLARKSSVLHLFLVLTIRRHELLRTWNRADACVRLAITPATSHIVQFVRPMTLLLTGAVARWMWNRGALQTVTTWSVISTNCIISTTVIIYYIQYFCFLFTKIVFCLLRYLFLYLWC